MYGIVVLMATYIPPAMIADTLLHSGIIALWPPPHLEQIVNMDKQAPLENRNRKKTMTAKQKSVCNLSYALLGALSGTALTQASHIYHDAISTTMIVVLPFILASLTGLVSTTTV